MLFKKQKTGERWTDNLRRRFHLARMAKQKMPLPRTVLSRPSVRPRESRIRSPAKAMLRRISFGILALGVLMGLVYVTFFSSFFVIAKISVEKDGNAVAGAAISPFLEKLKGKNILLIDADSLAREIEQNFKHEILFVKIKKSYPRRVTIKVTEYPAVINLKIITPEKTQKFIINQIGYGIAENSEQKDLPIITVNLPKTQKIRTIIIEKEKLAPIIESFTGFTGLFGMKVPEGEWKKTERELHMKTERGFYVWIDLTAPIPPQLSKLKRALTKLDIYHENLLYIDLRIAGGESEKVIYKRK